MKRSPAEEECEDHHHWEEVVIKLLSKQWIFIYLRLHDDVVPTEHSYHCSNSLAVGPEKLNLQYPFVKKIQSMGKTAQS